MNSKFENKLPRKRQLQWTNAIVSLHDLVCECDHPLQHTVDQLHHIEPTLRPPQCPTTTAATEEEDTIDGLKPGDLDALFGEDVGEDEG